METYLDCLSGEAVSSAVCGGADGRRIITFATVPGLYQFSALLDARAMNWDELYVNLELFHNKNARTGPWDFDLTHENAPLVPSYWVWLDGLRLGLWYMQRVSLPDIAARQFRGRMAFHVAAAGTHTLEFVPYRVLPVHWRSAKLEPDPEDTLDRRVFDLTDWERRAPAARWADPRFWAELRGKLETTHATFREPLASLFRWVHVKITPEARRTAPPGTWGFASALDAYHPEDILPLLAERGLTGRDAALAEALGAVDDAVALPHWGNPREGAYGCDGDMNAAHMLRALAWAWHALQPELGDKRRERLRAKLRLQGTLFFNLCLLQRDYWGGSILQDHGKVSLAAFGAAAIHLLGVVPEAALWTAYAIPRMRRSLDAMPTDGHIPPSSHGSPILYLDNPTFYRDALLALTGTDILDEPKFQAVVDYLANAASGLSEPELIRRQGQSLLLGGANFLGYMAGKHHDTRAAWLQALRLRVPEFTFGHGVQQHGYYHGVLWALLTYDPGVPPTPPTGAGPALCHLPDSGVVRYRDTAQDLELSLQCGPWCGHNAYRVARGPCDRMEVLSGSGHFTVASRGEAVLVTPDAGYRLCYHTRNLLLVDDQGPQGDIGYPMSIPSFPDRGEAIEAVRWDPEARTGCVRLDLAPAYPADLGVAIYTREFILEPGRPIIVRDHVVLTQPRRLAWHFHGLRSKGVTLCGPLTCHLGCEPALRILAQPAGIALRAAVHPTEVVYSYSSAFQAFDHVRYETVEATEFALVDFVLTRVSTAADGTAAAGGPACDGQG
jgi:hypothetical protein